MLCEMFGNFVLQQKYMFENVLRIYHRWYAYFLVSCVFCQISHDSRACRQSSASGSRFHLFHVRNAILCDPIVGEIVT